MKLRKSSGIAGSLLLVAALSLSGGCGFKTPPVPPQTVVPKAIEDLRYTMEEEGARLTWTYPQEKVTGDNLEEILSFQLYRAEIPLDDFCSTCPIPFGEPIAVEGGAPGVEQRNTAEFYSGLLRSGNKYYFKVTSRTNWLAESEPSNIVSFVFHTPAAAPLDLRAAMAGNDVRLSWSPVKTLADGNSADLPLRYQVQKSTDGQQYSDIGAPLESTTYVDSGVERGNTYSYRVKSAMLLEEALVEGSLSSAVSINITDTVPPPQVSGVTVVASATNIRIFWDRVSAEDLAGYRIYRRLADDKESSRVGEVGPTQTIYTDNEMSGGDSAYYSVAAFDQDGNVGEKSEEVTTRH